MSKYKKLIDKAVLEADTKTMHEINHVIDKHLMKLEIKHPSMYWDVVGALHEIVNGEHFDQAMAEYAVAEMENEDGTTGQHWTYEDTSSVAASSGITFDTFNAWDWFYVLNMWYSDYSQIIGNDTAMYVKMAKTWLMDKDVEPGKAWRYWSEVVC